MIRSRPGFTPVITVDDAPQGPTQARVTRDMQPAISRGAKNLKPSPVIENPQPEAMAVGQALPPAVAAALNAQTERMAAARSASFQAPELLVNPAPTEPPHLTEQ